MTPFLCVRFKNDLCQQQQCYMDGTKKATTRQQNLYFEYKDITVRTLAITAL